MLHVFALVVAGCGSSSPSPRMGNQSAGDPPEGRDSDRSPLLEEFHDVLGPAWQARLPDLEYARRACAANRKLDSVAARIAAASPPDTVDPSGWTHHGSLLRSETEALTLTCGAAAGPDWAPNVRLQLSAVRERFELLKMAARPSPDSAQASAVMPDAKILPTGTGWVCVRESCERSCGARQQELAAFLKTRCEQRSSAYCVTWVNGKSGEPEYVCSASRAACEDAQVGLASGVAGETPARSVSSCAQLR